jgi:hypothetical protein
MAYSAHIFWWCWAKSLHKLENYPTLRTERIRGALLCAVALMATIEIIYA